MNTTPNPYDVQKVGEGWATRGRLVGTTFWSPGSGNRGLTVVTSPTPSPVLQQLCSTSPGVQAL